MSEREFIAYVGDPDIHDGTIKKVEHEGDKAHIIVKGASGIEFAVDFIGVKSIKSNRPEGMMLYSLSEMKAEPPFRLFIFANWEEKDDAFLEILARDFKVFKQNGTPR